MAFQLRSLLFVLGALFLGIGAATCRPDPAGGGGDFFSWFDASVPEEDDDAGREPETIPPERCHIPLARFTTAGSGAHAKQVETAEDLIGGPNAHGKPGDFVIS